MSDPRPDNVAPVPALEDIAVHPVPESDSDRSDPENPPADDLTLPAEG